MYTVLQNQTRIWCMVSKRNNVRVELSYVIKTSHFTKFVFAVHLEFSGEVSVAETHGQLSVNKFIFIRVTHTCRNIRDPASTASIFIKRNEFLGYHV